MPSAATYRVEWLGVDGEGNQHRYVSHLMPQADAQAMAATLRRASATTASVEVLDAEHVHSSLAP